MRGGKLNRQEGFTLQELLLVLLITLVLLSLSVVGIVTYMRQLQLAELDNAAKSIFLAAQNRAVLLEGSQQLNKLVIHSDGNNALAHVEVFPGSAETTQITAYVIGKNDSNIKELLPDGTIDPTLWDGDFYVIYEPESGSVVDVFYSDGTLPVGGDFRAFYDTWRTAPKSERMASRPMVGYYGGAAAESGTTISLRTPVINIHNDNTLRVEITYWVPRSLTMGADHTVDLTVELSYQGQTVPLPLSEEDHVTSSEVAYVAHTYTWSLDDLEGTRFRDFFGTAGTGLSYGGDFTVSAEVTYSGSLKVNGARKTAADNSLFETGSGGSVAYLTCLRHLQNLDEDFSGVKDKTAALQTGDILEVEGYQFQPVENDALLSCNGGSYVIEGLTAAATGEQPAGVFGTLAGTAEVPITLKNLRLVNTSVTAETGPAGALVGSGTHVKLDNCLVYWENQSEQATNLRGELGDSDEGIRYQITGSGTAGGLAGVLTDSTVTGCAAATLVEGDTAGGLAGQGSGLTVTGSYAASYLKGGHTAGLVGNLTGSAHISQSYAVGFMEAGEQAAGLCLGTGMADVGQSYSAMLFPTDKTVQNYPLCQSGTYTSTHFLASERFHFEGTGKDLGVTYADLTNPDKWAGFFGDAFAPKSAAQSHPYNLQTTLSLTTFLYPGLAELDHWGDWGAQFQNGSLVYYEKYTDGSYGFKGGVVNDLPENADLAVLDGYAVAYQSTDEIVGIGGTLTVTYQTAGGQEKTWTGTYGAGENDEPIYEVKGVADLTGEVSDYYLLPLPGEVVNTDYAAPHFYQKITIQENREQTEKRYYYNPHFANDALAYEEGLDLSALASRLQALVRTPRHLYQLSLHTEYYASAHQYRFVQQLDLDYSQYDQGSPDKESEYNLFIGNWSQAPIGTDQSDPFRGSYYGGSFRISGVRLAPGERQYVGLFGYSTGVLDSVVFHQTQPITASRSGSSSTPLYAGALAGYNGGSITNCAAYGVEIHGSGYSYSTLYLGGLVGLNRGTVRRSAAEGADLTAMTSLSHAYAGGLVGRNAAGGIVSQCYAVGQVSVTRARFGEVYACGFAGANEGAISGSYAAVALTAAGEGSVFGFCPDATTGCYYLNEGNFTYRNTHYTARYTDHYTDPAAQGVTWDTLTGADFARQLGMSDQVYADATGGEYPYPGAVTDADGQPVHYGEWPDRMALGPMGVYYWEALEINKETSYHFSVLSLENGTVEKRSTLSTVHGDGGVVTGYGYGYFYEGTQAPQFTSSGIGYGGDTWFVPQEGLENEGANTALSDLMGGKYTFRSYDTWGTDEAGRGLFTVQSGQAESGQPPYGTWTLEQGGQTLAVRLNPFFADSMGLASGQTAGAGASNALPGTEQNPYEVRSIDQLQFINWNQEEKDTNTVLTKDNNTQFPYLCYIKNDSTTLRTFYWNQSHDLTGGGKTYTPIAEFYDQQEGQTGSLSGWFGGTYDGQDYLIANVNIQGQRSSCAGLFGAIFNGVLRNVVLYSEDGKGFVNSYSDRENPANSTWYAIGGLAGLAASTQGNAIENCAVAGYTITDSHKGGGGWGGTGLGGLLGISNMKLSGCSAVTNIVLSSDDNDNVRVGGLVGTSQGSISNSYTGGSIRVTNAVVASNRGIYIGGISGGIYIKPLAVGTVQIGQSGQKKLTNQIENCYTYVELPNQNDMQVQWNGGGFYGGGITALYAIGGDGDLRDFDGNGVGQNTGDKGETTYINNYYLDSVVMKNNPEGITVKDSQGRIMAETDTYTDTNLNPLNPNVTALTYDKMEDMEKDDGLLKRLNANGGGFAPVTTQTTGGEPLAGRYSFGSDPSLLGRDYPFPTILTQDSEEVGGTAHVHYGDWPLEGIRRKTGALPVNLDLFADYKDGQTVWTEQLTLSAVAGGGSWGAVSQAPDVVTAAIDQSGNLTLTAQKAGSTVVTVTYALGKDSYSLDIEVNVTAQLRLAAGHSPVIALTGGEAAIPLVLLDRDSETLPEDLAQAITLENLTVEYDAAYFDQAEVAKNEDGTLTLHVAAVAGEDVDALSQMTVGFTFTYLGKTYTTTSPLTLRAVTPEITMGPLVFSFDPDDPGDQEQTLVVTGDTLLSKLKFALQVDGAPLPIIDLTIAGFEEAAEVYKDVIWVQWTEDDTGTEVPGSLSVTAYAQELYPASASVRVELRFQYQDAIHTLRQDLIIQVEEKKEGEGEP